MKSLAIGYWAEPNKLPPEYNHVRKEFLPVFQGEEVIHCMWKKQHCGYCNDTQLVFAPKRLKGVEDYMSTCYMHDPCGGGGKGSAKGGKGSRAAKQVPKGSVSVSSNPAVKQKNEDVNTADMPEFEPHDEQKAKMVEEATEREADHDIGKMKHVIHHTDLKKDKKRVIHDEDLKMQHEKFGDQSVGHVANYTSPLPPVAGDEDEDGRSSTGMAKALAGEKVAPTDMNYWKPGFLKASIIKSEGKEPRV